MKTWTSFFCQVNFAYFKETLKKTKRKKDKDDDEEMDSEDEEDPFRLVVRLNNPTSLLLDLLIVAAGTGLGKKHSSS